MLKQVEVTNVFRRNEKSQAKVIINKGGAGSSKSYSLCQFYLLKRLFAVKGWCGLVLRKTRQANKISCYKMFFDMIQQYELYDNKNHNKSDMIFSNPKLDSYILFAGLDNRERIKSTQWHDIWIEEANEFNKEDYLFIKNTRLFRGVLTDNFRPQLRISYNPVNCWIKNLVGQPDVELIHSTYRDNPFCNEDYKKTLEGLKNEDESYYKIYTLGEDAEVKNIIFKPFERIKKLPDNDWYDDIIYGLDFGFTNQSALVQIGYKDRKRYLRNLIYQTHLTNSQLIEKAKNVIPEHLQGNIIYADNAEPDRIQEFCDAGFNCLPADKEVIIGIDFCRRNTYVIEEDEVELEEEREDYKYREDKNGNQMEEPVKFKDHLMSAIRYADYTHNKNFEPPIMEQIYENGVDVLW